MEATTVRKSSAETASTSASDLDMSSLMLDDEPIKQVTSDDITVNDTLKVIFVGMAMAGKTSMIKRLIEGKGAQIPKRDERTVGVDIYEWDPRDRHDWDSQESIDIDTRIEIEDKALAKACGDVNVKFSVWDFAGQHVYHATHELFFSPRSLYVLVWDMGATNRNTLRKKSLMESDQGAFRLSYDSSDDEDDDFLVEEEARRADRALERDIDEKVQFWVDCIQSSAPGAAILPVASFDDYFSQGSSQEEAERRCNVMKNRLLKHEERRIAGIKERLQEYVNENRANDEGALRLQQLLCPYTRPKLIFGNDEKNSVVRVSGTKFTGFDRLTEKLVHIATGKERPAGWKYPIFRGHVGAQIPRMRLEVREAVREMRDRFKVVEWGYFLSTLRERGLMSVEDISDALHFLTNIGELSYFGNVFPEKSMMENRSMKDDMKRMNALSPCAQHHMDMQMAVMDDSDSDDMDDDDERRLLLMDDTVSTLTSTRDDSSLSTTDNLSTAGLSQYVFLNPRWLVAAVACILRHDLDREIRETRRTFERLGGQAPLERGESFSYEANLNCPVITASDAGMLWHAKKFTKKAAERAKEYSNNLEMTPFDFLQRLLIRFGVFVPIDLSIDKALLGGKEYAQSAETQLRGADAVLPDEEISDSAQFFFLPSLLGPGEPAEAWTYKNSDSWKTTLCHSILFPDGVPPGLMERITAAVLSSIYSVARQDRCFRVKEILCWRTAFFIKLGTEISRDSEEVKESVVEIFAHLADRESHLCVGSDAMGTGMRRLILSGKGQVGDGGRKIWTGGYLLVIKAIGRVMAEYGGLEYEKQGFCPECLSKKAVSQASSWDWTVIRTAGQNGDESMRCRHGHRVDTRLVAGPCDSLSKPKTRRESIRSQPRFTDSDPIIPVNDLLRGVVLVGLWDGRTRKIVRVGSGFIVDKKRGLIVTASHTLMNIWGDRHTPFGSNYYGLRDGKIVIGVIPGSKESDNESDETEAVFRYFAKIAAKDPSIEEKGECQADVCVLRITTRMEHDVGGNGEGIGDQPERLLLNNPDALKRENLQKLKVTEKCELDEQVRILGYNQGGEGLLGPGESLNRYVDFARGYVCKKFATGEESGGYLRHRFKPLQEFVVICPTIGGHSGGPCVNQQGEVLGILSRADPAENQRCYLVPASAWKAMVKKAKNTY
jgi:GTPase SAR1 family protein